MKTTFFDFKFLTHLLHRSDNWRWRYYIFNRPYKVKFRRRTSHEPNRMQMRKILCSPSFTFDSAHVRTASELGLKYQNFRSSLIAYRVHRAFNQSRTNAQYNYLVCDLWEQAFPVHVGNFSLSLTREPPTQMLSGYSRRFQRERNWEWVRKIRSRGREWGERNLYIFLQRRRFLPSVWLSLCISIFQTSFF